MSFIFFSETWFDKSALACKLLYELPNYRTIHQVRNHGKGWGV